MTAGDQNVDSAHSPPRFDVERCVHGRSPFASCAACAEACPRDALILSDNEFTVSVARCDGCGLCQPACPERAIVFDHAPTLSRNRDGRISVWAACSEAIPRGDGVVPCLDAIGLQALMDVAPDRLSDIIVSHAKCNGCKRSNGARFESIIDDFNRLRQSAGLARIAVKRLPADHWREQLEETRARADTPDDGRRHLLRRLVGLSDDNSPRSDNVGTPAAALEPGLFPAVPEIDGARCKACHACARICPHEAIVLHEDPRNPRYELDPGQCTGCRLCVDLCEEGAMGLSRMAPGEQTQIALRRYRCQLCGVPFYLPVERAEGADYCWICAGKQTGRQLYQVLP